MLRQASRLVGRCTRAGSLLPTWRAEGEQAPCPSGSAWRQAQGFQCGRSQHDRLYSRDSVASSIEELNQELAANFGAIAADLGLDGSLGSPPKGDVPQPSSSPAASPGLERQAEELNRELLDFLGPATTASDTAAAAVGPPESSVGLGPQSLGTVAATHSSGGGGGGSSSPKVPQAGSGTSADAPHLTHVDASGRASMVDVSEKADTVRSATATARVLLGREVYELVAHNQMKKGDVLTVAQLAGVMGAKHTSALIPLCHNILLSKVHVELALAPQAHAVHITALAKTVGPTGVEMEALVACTTAALTVYDMVKAASKDVVIADIKLAAKSGGRSGDYVRGRGAP